jgi:prepilin-type N-terminal cleavage/methylation domain-containing protein
MRQGTTLPELVVVLALLAVVGTAALPAARRQADRAALAGAREAVAALVLRTRLEAMLRGGATLSFDVGTGRAWISAGDSSVVELALTREFGTTLELGGYAEGTTLAFDALGIGRLASRTIVLRRGQDRASIVVAAYGRVLRR